jgi:hypothetical protein
MRTGGAPGGDLRAISRQPLAGHWSTMFPRGPRRPVRGEVVRFAGSGPWTDMAGYSVAEDGRPGLRSGRDRSAASW